MSVFAIVNASTGICDNVIILEETSKWQPHGNFYKVNITDITAMIGWHHDKKTNVWTEIITNSTEQLNPAIKNGNINGNPINKSNI
jgi:hypothetical protein